MLVFTPEEASGTFSRPCLADEGLLPAKAQLWCCSEALLLLLRALRAQKHGWDRGWTRVFAFCLWILWSWPGPLSFPIAPMIFTIFYYCFFIYNIFKWAPKLLPSMRWLRTSPHPRLPARPGWGKAAGRAGGDGETPLAAVEEAALGSQLAVCSLFTDAQL